MNKDGYIYIGQYYHKHGKDLQELGITEKKIGKTINLNNRERGLNSTKMTIGYTIVAAWKVNNMDAVETGLHTAFDDNRLDGEWFEDVNDDLIQRVSRMMKLFNLGEPEIVVEDKDKEAKTVQRKATTVFTAEYNGKKYETQGSLILQNVCNDLINDGFDLTSDLPLIYDEPQLNPNNGQDYTRELINGKRVMTCIGNAKKAEDLTKLAKALNVEINVNYEYILK